MGLQTGMKFWCPNSKARNDRYQIRPRFRLIQHIRYSHLLTLITEYLGCGIVVNHEAAKQCLNHIEWLVKLVKVLTVSLWMLNKKN